MKIKKQLIHAITILFMITVIGINSAAVKYDQRQEGQVNVRADLENFVVLIIPTSTSSGVSLFDLLTRMIPHKGDSKKSKNHDDIEKSIESDEELKHFIESKSAAPYRVDISRTRSHLAKLHPELLPVNEEILISPTIQVKKLENATEENETPSVRRFRKAIVQVPDELYITGEIKGEKFEKQPIPISELNIDQEAQTLAMETDLIIDDNNQSVPAFNGK